MDTRPDDTKAPGVRTTTGPADRLTTTGLALVVLGYVVVALAQSWPLALHLSTHLTGVPGSDTGAYVWNTWVFRHQLLELGESPYWTTSVLPLDGPSNLALHNYTEFANLLALPLQPALGVVRTFNLVYIVNAALAGIGMFVLARRVTGRTAESWIAGALFACAPFLVARGAQHFSLAAAAPLPLFVYWFDRAWVEGRLHLAAAAGATVAWAAYSDPYYAVYCVMMAVLIALTRLVAVSRVAHTPRTRRAAAVLGTLAATAVGLIGLVHVAAGGVFTAGPITIAMRTLYTPVLVVTVLIATRFALRLRPHFVPHSLPQRAVRTATIAVATCTVLLAPKLHAVGSLIVTDDLVTAPVLWRSSAPGVDLASFFIPNPNHPLTPAAVTAWLALQPGRFDENVVSLSFVALLVIAIAWRRTRFRPDRLWSVVTLGFASLAVGPFLSIGGVPTFVPTPWTFLRYVPLVGEARMPPRFAIVVFMGLAVVFAAALVALGRQHGARRRRLLAVVGVALVVELWPVPRRLISAEVPAVYQAIATDPRPVRVLDLPFGVRDGLSSLGDFSAASQFYQTLHGKEILGGYLSRVDERTKAAYRERPVVAALLQFSEGRTPGDDTLVAARRTAPAFVTEAALGYVVIDTARTTPALAAFAIDTLALQRVGAAGSFELYATSLLRDVR